MADRIDLDAIRARVAVATPGPWINYGPSGSHPTVSDVSSSATGDSVALVHGASADLIAHAPADLAALCDEVERLRADREAERVRCIKVCMSTAGMLVDAGDCAGANGARLCAETLGLLTPAVESDTTELARLRAEVERLREIIAGRDRAPTDAEIEAHAAAGGLWWVFARWSRHGDAKSHDIIHPWAAGVARFLRDGQPDARWWPLDASGAPCAWPVVTEGVG